MRLTAAVLENDFVRLEPFEEGHKEPLRLACDADPELWPAFYYISLGGAEFDGGQPTAFCGLKIRLARRPSGA